MDRPCVVPGPVMHSVIGGYLFGGLRAAASGWFGLLGVDELSDMMNGPSSERNVVCCMFDMNNYEKDGDERGILRDANRH